MIGISSDKPQMKTCYDTFITTTLSHISQCTEHVHLDCSLRCSIRPTKVEGSLVLQG